MIKAAFATVLMVLVFLLVVLGVGWLAQGNEFFLYKFFAPRMEDARRQVFESTKSYNQGMIMELRNMQYQYVQADQAHKAALASLILHQAADYPDERLPADLRAFVGGLRVAAAGGQQF